jgi:hypothetical protein
MPTCSVNIQPDRVTAKLAIQVLQYLEEAFTVASLRLDCAGTTQKRSNPTGNIQSFLVLAGCRNLQPLPDKRPAPAKAGMQGKATFVLENNSFFRPQRFEFFLGPWRISSHPRLSPEGTHGWRASIDTRVDASNTEPGVLSALRQSGAVNELPTSDRPSGLGSNRTSGAIVPDAVPTEPRFLASSALGVRVASWGSALRPRLCLLPGSSGSRSSVSGREPRKSSLVVALPARAAGWLSLYRPRLRELFRPGLIAAFLMPSEDSRGMCSCPQYNRMAVIM